MAAPCANSNSCSCSPPSTFPFPYPPYSIQHEAATHIWRACERGNGSVAIMESPTGTGKSLTLITAILHWMLRHQPLCPRCMDVDENKDVDVDVDVDKDKNKDKDKKSHGQSQTPPKWLLQQAAEHKKQLKHHHQNNQQALKQIKKHVEKHKTMQKQTKRQTNDTESGNGEFDRDRDRDWELEWDDEHEETLEIHATHATHQTHTHSTRYEALVKARTAEEVIHAWSDAYEHDEQDERSAENDLVRVTPQFIFTSRTHSQLSQIVEEVRKTPFVEEVRVVTLASRQQLCVHPEVQQLQSVQRMNDACQDMLNGKKVSHIGGAQNFKRQRSTQRCPYLDDASQQLFRNYVISEIYDLEDIAALGKKLDACAYFGTRKAQPVCHMVVLPYQSLLHAGSREQLGITLKDSIVVIDEAHNIIEAINDMESVELTKGSLSNITTQLQNYLNRYQTILKPSNSAMIRSIHTFASQCVKLLDSATAQTDIVTVNEFLFRIGSNLDMVNPFRMSRFLKESRLHQKLRGFAMDEISKSNNSSNGLYLVSEFMLKFAMRNTDCRIIITNSEANMSIRLMNLNPAHAFAPLLAECRTVILAGGTMQPMSQFSDQLFDSGRYVSELSVGHVIPPENVLALALARGPSGESFDFTMHNRNNYKMIEDLGSALVNFSKIVQGGIVVFFPSFAYEQKCMEQWDASGITARIQTKKAIFREPRGGGPETDRMLTMYTTVINGADPNELEAAGIQYQSSHTGALLSCVIGAKMSEGINFADNLARLVVVIGMPYANPTDRVLREKMDYLDRQKASAGRRYYETICWRAINQSVGRAVRHITDYAAIVLVDHRYAMLQANASSCHLPLWIKNRFLQRQILARVYHL